MQTDTVIIGAGQAGLSIAKYLQEFGRSFVILEKNDHIGASWEDRYDSLTLDSFAKYSHLEGFPFPGDQKRQPSKDEVADYLRAFAHTFGLAPIFCTTVRRITKNEFGFGVETTNGTYYAKHVVLATGPFDAPYIPAAASTISTSIKQVHSKEYRNPAALPAGATLVVGGGNSGGEIVQELSDAGREVYFSYTGTLKSVTSSPLSQWMAYVLGLAHVPKRSLLGKLIIRYTKGKSVGMNIKGLLASGNVVSVGRFMRATEDSIVCEQRKITGLGCIVWATGYVSDFSVLEIPELDLANERRGVTNIPGLYVMNIRWQWSKSSSHLAGVSRDAKYIARHIARSEKNS